MPLTKKTKIKLRFIIIGKKNKNMLSGYTK